jgi:hypothetical protein
MDLHSRPDSLYIHRQARLLMSHQSLNPKLAGPPGTTMSVQANSTGGNGLPSPQEPDTEENDRRFSPNAAQQNLETVPDQSQEPPSLPEPSEIVTTRHGPLRAEFRRVRQLHSEVLSLRSNPNEERTALRYARDALED